MLRICKERTGIEFDLASNGAFGDYKAQPQTDGQFLLFYLLMADRVFEEWVLNPTLYSLIDYLMRGQQQISSITSFVKWKGERKTLGLHSDCPPDRDGRLPACSDVANAAYCLTDYTLENGAIAMVPGSHLYCRLPRPGEGENSAIPVEAEAGSLIVWHGNTWHGAFEKKTDGLRPQRHPPTTAIGGSRTRRTTSGGSPRRCWTVIRLNSRAWLPRTTTWVGTKTVRTTPGAGVT